MSGTWIAAKHWYGWLIVLGSEGLWLAYARHRNDGNLALMSLVWAAIATRNTYVTRKAQA